ncbi:MAG: hypothetical protein F6K22_14925 [Okeania sp. SIO2F4]|uniref:hypothetical protein n=1 Tax=Okeania sp. SIO2F4 TaxID=2607790 RepID=UPI00142B434C|nr:hypothetical protein [Okeania sp. SIO2F4]NES04015.1 hypothetical protein [Okeania sp. SIO2F4]
MILLEFEDLMPNYFTQKLLHYKYTVLLLLVLNSNDEWWLKCQLYCYQNNYNAPLPTPFSPA